MPLDATIETMKAHLSPAAVQNIEAWLSESKYQAYRDEVMSLIEAQAWEQLEDAFFKVIEFGTGGRRGTVGVGSNRINKVTMGESAQALCRYALSLDKYSASKGVVIACDTRLSSPELSAYVATVCAANGFKTYLFDGYRSTPELSFALRQLGCAIGIVISASHNPPADNGFKAYWSDGGQLVAPHDRGVLNIAAAIESINTVDYDEAVKRGDIALIGSDIDTAYVAAVLAQAVGDDRQLDIVYSPLHGAGQRNTLPVLQAAGFSGVQTVSLQMSPDGNFPTVENGKPNPEEKSANDLAVAQMLANKADIAITNDPDADRIGVTVNVGGGAVYLNGNQSAAIATEYVLSKLKQQNELTNKHYIAKTIVTTDLLDAIAEHYNAQLYGNMLIGFKYIGELVRQKETTDEVFVIGGEESYGLLKGDYARDKDGAVGALVLAECAAEQKKIGATLYDYLLDMYRSYGVYAEHLATVVCPGAKGFQQMQSIMQTLRSSPPKSLNGQEVTAVIDYSTLERREQNGHMLPVDCKAGDVVSLEFNGDKRCRITVRPSGTEPKLKVYIQWFEPASQDVAEQYRLLEKYLHSLASELEGMIVT